MHYTEFSKLISVSVAEEYLVFLRSTMSASSVALVVKMLVDFLFIVLVQIIVYIDNEPDDWKLLIFINNEVKKNALLLRCPV